MALSMTPTQRRSAAGVSAAGGAGMVSEAVRTSTSPFACTVAASAYSPGRATQGAGST